MIPPQTVSATDQQYASVKQLLNHMLALAQADDEQDESVAWAGTVQAALKQAKEDPDYLDRIIQLSVAAFIRLAKREQ